MGVEATVERGFMHPDYARSLTGWGRIVPLERCGGWLLVRPIAGSAYEDGRAGYRQLLCRDWAVLADDLADLGGIVSVVAVTDPFGAFEPPDLQRAFPDLVEPYKQSFVVDLRDPRASDHHRARARKAGARVGIRIDDEPVEALDDWERLYDELRHRYDIRGLAAFSRESFARQLATPGCVTIRAFDGDACVSMSIYYVIGEHVYSHLVASDAAGYRLAASYAVHAAAIETFAAAGARWLDLGSGAGSRADPDDGLSNFKRGWASGTRETYICGRIVDHQAYAQLSRERGMSDTSYFPAYRAGEQG